MPDGGDDTNATASDPTTTDATANVSELAKTEHLLLDELSIRTG